MSGPLNLENALKNIFRFEWFLLAYNTHYQFFIRYKRLQTIINNSIPTNFSGPLNLCTRDSGKISETRF